MRSYYAHLETAKEAGKKNSIKKPVLRASAIFPAFYEPPNLSTRLLFMGYWMLKRNITQITAVATLRSLEGAVLYRESFPITEPKTYSVSLTDLLEKGRFSIQESFKGSMELEFFSIINLVFPYPAVVVNIYGPHCSSVVHTAQRIYNDYEDLCANSQTNVAESGFNIYADENHEPFLGMVNGPLMVPNAQVNFEFHNAFGEVLKHTQKLGDIGPLHTQVLYPAQQLPLREFLRGRPGAGKAQFHLNWVFPRLLAGNIQHAPSAMTITHTYYDCTHAISDSDYWFPVPDIWYPAVLMLPLRVDKAHFTKLYFYPIYSPSEFFIDLEIMDASGQCLGKVEEALHICSPEPTSQLTDLNMKEICNKLNIPCDRDRNLAVRIIARIIGNSRLPSRIKLALDIGTENVPQMPCNICTNLQPCNPDLETKPTTFRWAPILADQPQASFWILNTSPAKQGVKRAEVKLMFYREMDTASITRSYEIPSQGFKVIRSEEDEELRTFFGGKVGWCTVLSTNPYTSIYYFAENPSGVIGGDHGF